MSSFGPTLTKGKPGVPWTKWLCAGDWLPHYVVDYENDRTGTCPKHGRIY